MECNEAAIRETSQNYVCTMMSDGGGTAPSSLNVRSYVKGLGSTTAAPSETCDWEGTMEQTAIADGGLRPANLFNSDPVIRLAMYTLSVSDSVAAQIDECVCDCERRNSCNTASARVNNLGAVICVLMTDGGDFVTTSVQVSTYSRIGSRPTQSLPMCNWQTAMQLESGGDSGTRPANLFNLQNRVDMFSEPATVSHDEFAQRCICACNNSAQCQVAVTRINNDNRFVCVLLKESGGYVETRLSVDVFVKEEDTPRNCLESFVDANWTATQQRPRNLFQSSAKLGEFRESVSSTSEADFTMLCTCSCYDRPSCSVAAMRTAGSSRVCTLLSEAGGPYPTSMQVQTFIRIA